MNNYRNEILNEFIDRYEKSSYYKGKSEKPRKISIVLHKKFPEYGHSFHYEETNELENIVFQLQSQGFVEFSKKRFKEYKETMEYAMKPISMDKYQRSYLMGCAAGLRCWAGR